MPDSVTRAIIVVIVTMAVALIAALWRFFRTGSRRARRISILALVVMAGLVVLYGVGRSVMRKRYDPGLELQMVEEVEQFIDGNREEIQRLRDWLDSMRATVALDDWLPEGEASGEVAGEMPLLLWGFQLRNEEPPGFDDSYGDFRDLEVILNWADDPETIFPTYDGQSPEDLAGILDKASAPYAIVAKLDSVVRAEPSHVDFGGEAGVSGEFTPGATSFGVAVVETATGRIVAHGRGEATNSDQVRITVDTNVLMNNLWAQTEMAARNLGQRLLLQSE